jgi:nicotinamidase-related amidase
MFTHTGPRMTLDLSHTGLVLTDMQNDFLSPNGGAYALIERSLAANNTADNLEQLLVTAKATGIPVFISPHYYYPHDHKWVVPLTPLEDLAHRIGLVGRQDPLSVDGFEGSGADFPDRYKPHICDGESIVSSPHKAYGTATNDLILQLRRRRVEQIILAGPVGNLCVEAHMRDFVENGFEVAMVRDATAGATNEEGDGYAAAMINWRFMAHALWSTEQTLREIAKAQKSSHRGSPTSSSTVRFPSITQAKE